jgi:hypothetical protein
MQLISKKKIHIVVLEYENGMTRSVKVRAISREAAERKALKFNANAKGIKRNA